LRLVILTGTGRCGSTLLSTLVNHHPEVLSLSELFTSLRPDGFSVERPDGEAMWRLLTEPHHDAQVMADLGLLPAELLYPLGTGRYRARDIPPLAAIALPHLTDKPDELLDELEPVIRSLPPDRLGRQYERLFDWLSRRFSRSLVVERSGASLEYLAELHETFPEASVVHIERDPLACALSMREHDSFRMARLRAWLVKEVGFDPYSDDREVDPADVRPPLRHLLPQSFDRRAYENYPFTPADFGWQWSALVMAGLTTLKALPSDQLHTLRYEDLVTDPRTVLHDLGTFMGLNGLDSWVDEAAQQVRSSQHASRMERLDDKEMADLRRSVTVASRALRRFDEARSARP
jgi:hypothetical protein